MDYSTAFGGFRFPGHLADLNRQLAAPAYICIGMALRKAPNLSIKAAAALCIVCAVGEIVERAFLDHQTHGLAKLSSDGILSTYAYGASVFLLARSLNTSKLAARFSSLGAISLAIYVCHLLYVWLFKAITPAMPGRTLVMILLTVACATATAYVLVRVPVLRDFCTPRSARSASALRKGAEGAIATPSAVQA
jgi:surface polysaccharide O-acyltransferase-like enzyme